MLLLHGCASTIIVVQEGDLNDISGEGERQDDIVEDDVLFENLFEEAEVTWEEGIQSAGSSHFQYNDRPIIGKVQQLISTGIMMTIDTCAMHIVHVTNIFRCQPRPRLQKGVLSQELDDWLANKLPPNHNYTAYIASRY